MFHGADTESLRQCAEGWETGAQRLYEVADRLLTTSHSVAWTGSDRDHFLTEAQAACSSVESAASTIGRLSADLRQQAEEQDRASEAADPVHGIPLPYSREGFEELVRRMAAGDLDATDSIRQLFGKEGKSTAEDLGGYLDPSDVDSRAVDVDNIGDFDLEKDLSQGRIGNCWFLASLASVAAQNPGAIEKRIELVEGETPDEDYWIVELWDGSEWIPHEVTQDEIVEYGVRDENGDITWMTIYERAAVEHLGGEYGDIERNFAGKGFDMVTGDNGSLSLNLDLDSIERKLDAGQSVVTSTPPSIPLIGPADDVVPGHVYVVDEIVRPADGSEPRIRLINPWGDVSKKKPQVIELTQSEYARSFISQNSLDN